MKRIAFALGLVAAATFAAPLAAQSRNSGPWWDPANTGTRSGSTSRVDTRDGNIYGSTRADGQWRRESRDRNGNDIYVRTRYDSNGNLIQERARRDTFGRYRVIDRRVISNANDRRNGQVNRGDNDRNNDGWDDRNGRSRNDRWDQNNGHDNGKHNGWYKNKGNNKGNRRD